MSRLKYSRMFSLLALAITPIAQADIFDDLASSGVGGKVDVDSAFADMLGGFSETPDNKHEYSIKNSTSDKKVQAIIAKRTPLQAQVPKKTVVKGKGEPLEVKSESYYLKNIPSYSMFAFNDEVKLLPRESHIHYKDGGRVYALPNSRPEPVTYCTVILNESGLGRRIRAGKEYPIVDVLSKTERYDVDGVGVMYKREVIFELEHEHLKKVYCMSNQKNAELDLGDLKELSGGSVGIKLRELLDI